MKYSMEIKALVMLALSVLSSGAQGAVGDVILWPVVTSSEIVNVGAGTKIYATVDMIPIRQTQEVNILQSSLVLAVVGPGWVNYQNSKAYISSGKTWQQASDLWIEKFGLHTVLEGSSSNMNWSGGCTGLTLGSPSVNSPSGTWYGMLWGPGETFRCTTVPISAYRCQITQTALTIDYGSVNAVDANGKLASTTFNMDCDGKVTVSIYGTAGGALVPLGTGLTANLSIDGKPLGTTMDIPAGNSEHVLSAVLSAKNVTAGIYNSSTALIISYQ